MNRAKMCCNLPKCILIATPEEQGKRRERTRAKTNRIEKKKGEKK